jgi:hypothetical protein
MAREGGFKTKRVKDSPQNVKNKWIGGQSVPSIGFAFTNVNDNICLLEITPGDGSLHG